MCLNAQNDTSETFYCNIRTVCHKQGTQTEKRVKNSNPNLLKDESKSAVKT